MHIAVLIHRVRKSTCALHLTVCCLSVCLLDRSACHPISTPGSLCYIKISQTILISFSVWLLSRCSRRRGFILCKVLHISIITSMPACKHLYKTLRSVILVLGKLVCKEHVDSLIIPLKKQNRNFTWLLMVWTTTDRRANLWKMWLQIGQKDVSKELLHGLPRSSCLSSWIAP